MDKNRFTIMVGVNVAQNKVLPIMPKEKALLIAPQFCGVRIGDYVKTRNGGEYRIQFVDEYCELDGVLATGLMVALGMEPQKITKRVFEETVKWDDYKEEEEEEERENDDTV